MTAERRHQASLWLRHYRPGRRTQSLAQVSLPNMETDRATETLTLVSEDSRIVDSRNTCVSGCVAAVEVSVADARGNHFDEDLIRAQVAQRDGLNSPFAL